MELYAFYSYLSMASYFDRDDVALPGFADYFRKASKEELEHAQKLMEFQNKRGGRITLSDIKKPARDEWGTGMCEIFSIVAHTHNLHYFTTKVRPLSYVYRLVLFTAHNSSGASKYVTFLPRFCAWQHAFHHKNFFLVCILLYCRY